VRLSGTTFSEVTPSTLIPHPADSMKQPTDRWNFNRNRESQRGYTLTPAQQAVAVAASPYNETRTRTT